MGILMWSSEDRMDTASPQNGHAKQHRMDTVVALTPSPEGEACAAAVWGLLDWLGVREYDAEAPRPVLKDLKQAQRQAESSWPEEESEPKS